MENNKYNWNYERLAALLVAIGNCAFTVYILMSVVFDKNFLYHQVGITTHLSLVVKGIVALLILMIMVIINLQFLNKSHRARMAISLVQTVTMAFIIRNIFYNFVYTGFEVSELWKNSLGFIVIAILLYNTLFSANVIEYFNLVKKES